MKNVQKILVAFVGLLMLAPAASAQVPVDDDTKKITYKEVVTQEGTPAKMYNQCIEWVNATYVNAADATRVRDPEGARIEIRHRIKVYNLDKNGNKASEGGVVQYDLTLEFKEGRYRYTFTNFTLMGISKFPLERWLDKKDPAYVPVDDIYLQQVDQAVRDLIESLKKGMKPKVLKQDNW